MVPPVTVSIQLLPKFILGFVVTASIGYFVFTKPTSTTKERLQISNNKNLSAKLYDEVKVLCFILTNPKNHKTKAIAVKETWGKRCNKLVFVSSQLDPELDVIHVPLTSEGRVYNVNKTRDGFLYIHDNFLNDYDWFLKADDDT